ncbi:MAG: hypothetical protein PHY02_01600 [Phycisphaerae bacterium]|nr:hypothetical protein [Phycisphaerae bacterium]
MIKDCKKAGGAAVNAGIDFQERIAALALVCVFTENSVSILFGIDVDAIPVSLAIEAAEAIDDIVIKCNNDKTIYIQAKRKLSLSTKKGSDFNSVIKQFIKQSHNEPYGDAVYAIATTSESSGPIKVTLKKILDAYRMSSDGPDIRTFSEAEKDYYNKFHDIVTDTFKDEYGCEMSKEEFHVFAQRSYVCVIDVESGMPHEVAAIALLTPAVMLEPHFIWSMFIKTCLSNGAKRHVIDISGLNAIAGRYRISNSLGKSTTTSDEILKLLAKEHGVLSSGREVLLMESPDIFGDSMVIAEFFRFADIGAKRLRFSKDRVMWQKDSTTTSKVYFRAATYSGVERFIEDHLELVKDKKVCIVGANGAETADNAPFAKAHSELCQKMLEERKDMLICLHCGKAISQGFVMIVELDDEETAHQIGCVHDECRRNIDRVLGQLECPIFKKKDFLKNFDLCQWAKLIVKGQTLLRGKKPQPICQVAWNPENSSYRNYKYCIRVDLKGGLFRFIDSRGKLDRYPKNIAEQRAKEFNTHLKKARDKKDPACYTSINWMHGRYSTLLALKEPEEECLECLNAEVVKYSEHIAKLYPDDGEFYTPLCYLVDTETEETIVIGNTIVMISRPMEMDKFLENAKQAGADLKNYEMRIIPSDVEFDEIVTQAFKNNLNVIIDPLCDKNGKLVNGYVICDMQELIKDKPEEL